jgi:hypothetical protein
MVFARKSTWYVTYEPIGPPRGRKERRRLSETFPDESEANVFAKARLADARKIAAGTINPHSPKRTIGSEQIRDWLNEHPPEA